MASPRLHLDADTSIKALYTALVANGHDVTRTPTPWMARDASDTEQLLGATAQGRVLFTFNARDFLALAQPSAWRPRTRRPAELDASRADCRASSDAHGN